MNAPGLEKLNTALLFKEVRYMQKWFDLVLTVVDRIKLRMEAWNVQTSKISAYELIPQIAFLNAYIWDQATNT